MTRIGNQSPTKSFVLPYEDSKGNAATELYNSSSNTSQEWQEIQLNNILATNEDGLWTHTKYGYAVPRRNGKGEVIIMRELYGIEIGEKILHTAHLASTSSAAAYRLAKILDSMGYTEVIRTKKGEVYDKHYVFAKQYGQEKITLLADGGGECRFRTRTSKGGLGEGFDLLIVDEAQEYTEDQDSTLKYVVSDSDNPQILMCGTPPTAISAGTVFQKYRNETLAGKMEDAGWAEWSVDSLSDPHDVELWYETNPSLGTILTERKIKAEIGDDVVDFNIQRLGYWSTQSLKSAISENEWNGLQISKPRFKERRLFVGVKFGKDGTNATMAIAAKLEDESIFCEVIDSRSMRDGVGWIVDWLEQAKSVQKVAIDGANGQNLLASAMKQARLKAPVLPTTKEYIIANAVFEQAVFHETIHHGGQDPLRDVVSHCEKRAIGSNGGFGYRAQSDELEIGLLDSVILAHWLCVEDRGETTKPRVR